MKAWSLKRTEQYGSEHYDEKSSRVTAAKVSPDGRSVTLEIEAMKPTWCMEIKYSVKAADRESVQGVVHNTAHRLGQ